MTSNTSFWLSLILLVAGWLVACVLLCYAIQIVECGYKYDYSCNTDAECYEECVQVGWSDCDGGPQPRVNNPRNLRLKGE